MIASPQTLAFFSPGEPVHLFTDAACTAGHGFVVKQKQKDQSWKPIMVSSRSLTDTEKNYAPIEAEVTALAWALKKTRRFLLGIPKFQAFVDHQPLVTIFNKKRLDEIDNRRIRRAVMKCQEYNMET